MAPGADGGVRIQEAEGYLMKTRNKIAIAKILYQLSHRARTLVGKSDVGIFHRNGLTYELDLAQGIDFSIFCLGSFEPNTTRALKKLIYPGFCVLDVGANIGAHTLTMAKMVGTEGQVVACEPTEFAFKKLCRNIELNPELLARTTAVQCFLGSAGKSEIPNSIYSGWPLTGGTDLHPKHRGSEQSTQMAIYRSIDEIAKTMALAKVHLIKMDVDGFECEVLSGAQETLKRDRPIFVMEVSPYVLEERGGSLALFLSYFSKLDYGFFDERTFSPLPSEPEALRSIIGDGASINVVARHKSSQGSI